MSAPLPVSDFLAELSRRGVSVAAEGDRLRLRGPREACTPKVQAYLRRRKDDLLAALRQADASAEAGVPDYRDWGPDLQASADIRRLLYPDPNGRPGAWWNFKKIAEALPHLAEGEIREELESWLPSLMAERSDDVWRALPAPGREEG